MSLNHIVPNCVKQNAGNNRWWSRELLSVHRNLKLGMPLTFWEYLRELVYNDHSPVSRLQPYYKLTFRPLSLLISDNAVWNKTMSVIGTALLQKQKQYRNQIL